MNGRVAMQGGDWCLVACMTALLLAPVNAVEAQTCARADFEAVVGDAGEALRALTQKNAPVFQAKLRQLKEKRGWTQEQLLAEGARFVKDDTITAMDEKSGTLLAKINSSGSGDDCKFLASMKADLADLVALQSQKWTYMFATVETELAK